MRNRFQVEFSRDNLQYGGRGALFTEGESHVVFLLHEGYLHTFPVINLEEGEGPWSRFVEVTGLDSDGLVTLRVIPMEWGSDDLR